jgi:RNA polymerase sigma factor (sigma-70 family)
MEINNCNKFKQFVKDSKKPFFNRLKYEFEEKKDFVLSMTDINTVMEVKNDKEDKKNKNKEEKPLYPSLRYGFKLSEDDFEDIFQESVIALYKNIGTPISCTLSSYFYIICRNQTLKHNRKESKIEHYNMSESAYNEQEKTGISSQKLNTILRTIPSERITPQIAETPDIVFDFSNMKKRVHKALDEMATKCKQLLTKFYIEGFSWTEIALEFDFNNADTAKASAQRCRNRFKEKYKELEVYVKEK